MIQIIYTRENYSVLAPNWMAAFEKAHDHLFAEKEYHLNDESYLKDIEDLEYLLQIYESLEYNNWANLRGETFRMDNTETELYLKEYDGSLLEFLRGDFTMEFTGNEKFTIELTAEELTYIAIALQDLQTYADRYGFTAEEKKEFIEKIDNIAQKIADVMGIDLTEEEE